MVPLKHTVSLARDFPLQFGQLLKTGSCTLQMMDSTLQQAYPGTYGYRVVAISPSLSRTAAFSPLRGSITDSGISEISGSDGSLTVSIRTPDTLPISEFDILTDGPVFGLPGNTLLQFEGSGIQSAWTVQLPPAANLGGLGDLLVVLITFNLRAQTSLSLYQTLSQLPASMSKFIILSSLKLNLPGLASLQKNSAISTLTWDMTRLGLPPSEETRTINNIAVIFIGGSTVASTAATFKTALQAKSVAITLNNGATRSTNPPITDAQSTVPVSPLNGVGGDTVNQMLSLVVETSANSGVDFGGIQDVMLGVDYTATY